VLKCSSYSEPAGVLVTWRAHKTGFKASQLVLGVFRLKVSRKDNCKSRAYADLFSHSKFNRSVPGDKFQKTSLLGMS